MLLGVGIAADITVRHAAAQHAAAQHAAAAVPIPSPIYWKQNLFLIPYQWSSASDPAAAQAVWLFVSKDNGATWQKISEAKPHVKAFNYHAEADGAYAFAIRTIDAQGRALPEGPHHPELVVIVDTTIPRIDELAGYLRKDGILDLRWRGTDPNLDPATWKIEAQTESGGAWLPVPIVAGSREQGAGRAESNFLPPAPCPLLLAQTSWQPPAGSRPVALRATVFDRAGNSAVYQAAVSATPLGIVAGSAWPTTINDSFVSSPSAALPSTSGSPGQNAAPESLGWVSSSTASSASALTSVPVTDSSLTPAPQPWPAGATARAPFRIAESANDLPTDAVTTYGRPAGMEERFNGSVTPDSSQLTVGRWTSAARQTAVDPPSVLLDRDRFAMADSPARPMFRPLEPFRQTSLGGVLAPTTSATEPISTIVETQRPISVDAAQPNAPPLPPGVEPKQVGSRTFALEYELADLGQWGASRVELWGTRDGGQTWQRFAEDDDHRSPLYVTVDDAGLYGFRIVVEAAGGPAADVPRAGDQPELWVAVDLGRPHAELVSIQPGSGNLADHLLLRWRAADDNLEPRPIALFYSSRSAGPWSAIATGLENTGEYAWRVERFVPLRIYVRLEARDKAGNLAAFQTADPVALEPPQPAGMIRAVQPAGPTATGVDAAFR